MNQAYRTTWSVQGCMNKLIIMSIENVYTKTEQNGRGEHF